MNILISSGLVMGIAASLHCVGMCGPLQLALRGGGSLLRRVLPYQFGRLFSYVSMGILLGGLGQAGGWDTYRYPLTFFAGSILVIVGITGFKPDSWISKVTGVQKFSNVIRVQINSAIQKKQHAFILGALNGVLPCGMSYTALLTSIAIGEAMDSGLFMLFFGLGTLPLLFGVQWIGNNAPLLLSKLQPLLLLSSGILLIYRSWGFWEISQTTICH